MRMCVLDDSSVQPGLDVLLEYLAPLWELVVGMASDGLGFLVSIGAMLRLLDRTERFNVDTYMGFKSLMMCI